MIALGINAEMFSVVNAAVAGARIRPDWM